MPRHGYNRDSAPRPERTRTPTRRVASGDVDEQVLRLRETGASYSAIARGLELRRAVDAHRAFIRAVGRREGEERRNLVIRESARLDALELRIRDRDAAFPDKVAHRLLGVNHLREALP